MDLSDEIYEHFEVILQDQEKPDYTVQKLMEVVASVLDSYALSNRIEHYEIQTDSSFPNEFMAVIYEPEDSDHKILMQFGIIPADDTNYENIDENGN